MHIPDKAVNAASEALWDERGIPCSTTELRIALEAAAPFIAAQTLRDAAHDWASNPEPWGDNEKDYRNELLDRADELEAGK